MTYTDRVEAYKEEIAIIDHIYDLEISRIKEDRAKYIGDSDLIEYTIYYNMLLMGVMDIKTAAVEAVYTRILEDVK